MGELYTCFAHLFKWNYICLRKLSNKVRTECLFQVSWLHFQEYMCKKCVFPCLLQSCKIAFLSMEDSHERSNYHIPMVLFSREGLRKRFPMGNEICVGTSITPLLQIILSDVESVIQTLFWKILRIRIPLLFTEKSYFKEWLHWI